MKKKDMRIRLFILLGLCINIPIQYFCDVNGVKYIYAFVQFIYLLFILMKIVKLEKINISCLIYFIYYIVFIIATIMNGGTVVSLFNLGSALVTCINLLFLVTLYGEEEKNLLATSVFFFTSIITINLITIALFPDGIYEGSNINPHYFLGQRNDSIEYILPGVLCFLVYSLNYKKKIALSLFLLIALITVILTWSANAIMSVVLMYLWLFISQKYEFKIVTPIKIFCATFIASYAIICLQIQYYFSWLVEDILGKSLTFTGRVKLWDSALYYIKESWLFGNGKESVEYKLAKIGHGNSAHNYFLDILYDGGIVLLIIFIIMMMKMQKAYKRSDNVGLKKISIGILIGYFLIWIATPIHTNTISQMFFSFFLITYLLNKKTKKGNQDEKDKRIFD